MIAALLVVGLIYSSQLRESLRYPAERDFLGVADSVCHAAGSAPRNGRPKLTA